MQISDVILVLAKATLLFFSGLAFLWFSRRSTPAARHLICLSVIGGSLAVLLTIFLPDSAVVIHVPAIAVSPTPGGAGPKGWPLAEFAVAIWASGCAFVALRFAIGCAVLSRVRRSATPLEGAPGARVFAADVSVPMVTGLFRPVILMPRAAIDWPESQRSAALRHERAHLERGDLWANFAGVAACAIYWFHPLIWILVRHLHAEQEAACDDAVLQSGFDSTEYAEALVETARQAGRQFLLPPCRRVLSCSMADGASVKARVIRVLSPGAARPFPPAIRRMSKGVLAGLMFALIAVSSVGAERIYKAGGAVTDPSVSRKINPEYTEEARLAKIQGSVILRLVVGSDGVARDIQVEQGIDSRLDQNAVEALRLWRFKPATRNARPVAVRATVAINFRLL